jgi:hypothetical protein
MGESNSGTPPCEGLSGSTEIKSFKVGRAGYANGNNSITYTLPFYTELSDNNRSELIDREFLTTVYKYKGKCKSTTMIKTRQGNVVLNGPKSRVSSFYAKIKFYSIKYVKITGKYMTGASYQKQFTK